MSWHAVKEVLAFGTPQGPRAFENVFKPTGKKGARGLGYGPKKAVLMVLAERHRWPKRPKAAEVQVTYADLAEAAACSVDTVKRACDWLDKAGLVVHEFAHDQRGRRASNRFFINFDGVEREEFSAQVLGQVVPKRRKPPKGQNALKVQGRLEGNLLRPKGLNAGDQYLQPISTDEREAQTLSLEERGSPQKKTIAAENLKACLPDSWSLPADWLAWTQCHFIGSAADIAQSAIAFHEHHQDLATALTPKKWETAWRRWCRMEKRWFAARCVKLAMPPLEAERAPAGIAPKIELTALQQWCKGIGRWHDKIGPEPRSEAEALERIAALEVTISKTFRSSRPTPAPLPTTEPKADASCA